MLSKIHHSLSTFLQDGFNFILVVVDKQSLDGQRSFDLEVSQYYGGGMKGLQKRMTKRREQAGIGFLWFPDLGPEPTIYTSYIKSEQTMCFFCSELRMICS